MSKKDKKGEGALLESGFGVIESGRYDWAGFGG